MFEKLISGGGGDDYSVLESTNIVKTKVFLCYSHASITMSHLHDSVF